MDDATRTRLEIGKQLEWIEHNRVGPAGEKPMVVLDHRQARALLAAYDTLLAERDRAIPVLAAAETFVPLRARFRELMDGAYGDREIRQYNLDTEAAWVAMVAAVATWRAAREG